MVLCPVAGWPPVCWAQGMTLVLARMSPRSVPCVRSWTWRSWSSPCASTRAAGLGWHAGVAGGRVLPDLVEHMQVIDGIVWSSDRRVSGCVHRWRARHHRHQLELRLSCQWLCSRMASTPSPASFGASSAVTVAVFTNGLCGRAIDLSGLRPIGPWWSGQDVWTRWSAGRVDTLVCRT